MPNLEAPPSNLLSLEQAANELRAPVRAVQRAVALGGLKTVNGYAGQMLFQPEDVRRYAAAGAQNLTPAWEIPIDGKLPSAPIDGHAGQEMRAFILGELGKQLPRQEQVAEWVTVDPERTSLQIRGQVTSAIRERLGQPVYPGMTPKGVAPNLLRDSWARGIFRAEVGKIVDAGKLLVPGAWSLPTWDALYIAPDIFRNVMRSAYASLQGNRFERSETYRVTVGGFSDQQEKTVTVTAVLPWSDLLPTETELIAASF